MANGNITIDESSLPYILGQINQRLENGDHVMERLTKALDRLPCADNTARLHHAEDAIDDLQEGQTYRTREGLKYWQGFIIAVITAGISVGSTMLFGG